MQKLLQMATSNLPDLDLKIKQKNHKNYTI